MLTLEKLECRDLPSSINPVVLQGFQAIQAEVNAVLTSAQNLLNSNPSLGTAEIALIAIQTSWQTVQQPMFNLIALNLYQNGDPNLIGDLSTISTYFNAINGLFAQQIPLNAVDFLVTDPSFMPPTSVGLI